jgi:uncharacterized protein (DUF305 family)
VRLQPTVRACRRRLWPLLAAAVLVVAGYLAGTATSRPDIPPEGSVDVGFVRDMIVHHEQAVTLAMIVLQRATVPAVREAADDIATSQQQEAGLMTGWLQQWGLPVSTTIPPMTWMTHPPAGTATGADPPMPGMATRQEVARLAVTRGRAADLTFCRLMLAHHLGALHMIDEEVKRGSRPEVLGLAERMRAAQQREITLFSRLVTRLRN